MTREETLAEYDVDERGYIRSPGRFEGEPIYAPAFYALMLDGCSDTLDWPDGAVTYIVEVDDADREEWPEISSDTAAIVISTTDTGFVYVGEMTQADLAELHAENEEQWEAANESDDEGLTILAYI